MGNEKHKTEWGNKRRQINKCKKKIKKCEGNANKLLLKQRMKSTDDTMDSLGQIAQSVSDCEKGIRSTTDPGALSTSYGYI